MASGKPVIGTKVGGLKETIVDGETGFLIQPRNSKQLSFYILKILSDEDLRKNLGKNSRKRIEENYSNNVLMVRILKIYLDAIAHNTEIRKRIHK
jgi:glycosyltransferase involved in cell wall biosynthesis